MKSGQLIRTLAHSKKYGGVRSLAISPDGTIPVSGNYDGTIDLWNLPTQKLIRTLSGHGAQTLALAISPNAQILVSTSTDNSYLTIPAGDTENIKLWDLKTGKLLRYFSGHLTDVRAVAISPDGQIFATGGGFDQTIKLWNLKTGKLLNSLTGHKGGIYSLAFSPNGQNLLSSSGDSTIKIWRVSP